MGEGGILIKYKNYIQYSQYQIITNAMNVVNTV